MNFVIFIIEKCSFGSMIDYDDAWNSQIQTRVHRINTHSIHTNQTKSHRFWHAKRHLDEISMDFFFSLHRSKQQQNFPQIIPKAFSNSMFVCLLFGLVVRFLSHSCFACFSFKRKFPNTSNWVKIHDRHASCTWIEWYTHTLTSTVFSLRFTCHKGFFKFTIHCTLYM